MEIKVEEKNNTAYAINSNNKSNNNISKFETILDSVSANSSNSQKSNNDKNTLQADVDSPVTPPQTRYESKKSIEIAFAIKRIIETIGLNPMDYARKDSTLDVRQMLIDYDHSNKPALTIREVSVLYDQISILYRNGLITDDDYFYVSKALGAKLEAIKAKMQPEKQLISLIDKIKKIDSYYNDKN
jgi:hypothetical protein